MQEMNFPNGEDKLRELAQQFEVPFEERYWTDMQARLPQKNKQWYLAKPFWFSVLGLGLIVGSAWLVGTSYLAKPLDTQLDVVPTQLKGTDRAAQERPIAENTAPSVANASPVNTVQASVLKSSNGTSTPVKAFNPSFVQNLMPGIQDPAEAEVIPTLPASPESSEVPNQATELEALPPVNWMIEALETLKSPYIEPQPMAVIQPVQNINKSKKGRFNWGIVAGLGYGYNNITYLEPQKDPSTLDIAEESINATVNTTSIHATLGLRGGVRLNKGLGLNAELLYKARPGLLVSMETSTTDTERENGYSVSTEATTTTISNLHLIELPLYLDVKIKRHHLIGGVKPAFVISAKSPYSQESRVSKYDMTSSGMPGGNSIISINSNSIASLPTGKIFRPGVGLMAGYQFDLSKHLNIAVRYSLGLFPMTRLEQTYKSLYAFNNSDFQLTLGYNF